MGQAPMDVEHEIGWRNTNERKNTKCEYLSPLKKRKVDEYFPICLVSQDVKKNDKKTEVIKDKEVRKRWDVEGYIVRLPVMLIRYLHLVLNVVMIGFICYAVVYVFVSIQRDIRYKVSNRKLHIKKEIEDARTSYEINKCHPDTRVPAIEELCNKWECTIKNGNGSVGYTRIIAEVFGDVLDGFVRKFSMKSSLIMGFFFFVFLTFGGRRVKK
ncbi:hypothetical protein CWI42_011620 [Ordospora colligata]|uniref:Brl1/Brr6 domain-containing protein n=1 Tax=Ordospora colligata OC4 TaxID=1354746 RepID=A0A0B2UMB4_9MICR|nr:uncharacterized protein M896_011620 [Ordospora colligata OC4]KHN70508.1 hypothetical protein M896_011620 [Ordospora colligata OC4]TBU17258.1 hypothetical protein CWI41_011620 [Ordospora colligata]TBU17508.1 hypothetical protein CWI40_011620 [Ordospora colligata]TBU19688.1 hypothetical protein CWI42_011620 [Ordospora colligata]